MKDATSSAQQHKQQAVSSAYNPGLPQASTGGEKDAWGNEAPHTPTSESNQPGTTIMPGAKSAGKDPSMNAKPAKTAQQKTR